MAPAEGSIEEPLTVLAELQRQGLIRQLGLSNVTAEQIDGSAGDCADRVRAESIQRGAAAG